MREKDLRNKRNSFIGKFYNNTFLIILFFTVAFLISVNNPFGGEPVTNEIMMVFSFVSFLFSILSGFFVSALWNRYTDIRELTSIEAARLEDLYETIKVGSDDMAKRIADKIDKYIIKALEYDIHKYQETISEEYHTLYKELEKLEEENLSTAVKNNALSVFAKFTDCRKEILSKGKDNLGKLHWITILMLAFITAALWIFIQFEGIFGILVGTILLFSILAVITILYDLNNLTWGEERIDIEIFERVYDIIDKPRYYPEEVLNEVTMPSGIKEYRVGILKNPDTHERTIKKVIRE